MSIRCEFVYKYGKADNILSSLKRHYLWSSYPEEFDDPYDSKVILDYSGCVIGISREDQEREARRKNRVISFSAVPDDPILWYYYADKYEGLALCFTNCSNDNSPSHCAISFENKNFKPTEKIYKKVKDKFPLIKVDYKSKTQRPKPYNPSVDSDAVLVAHLKTKHDSWKFEEEYRAILPLKLLANPFQRQIYYQREALHSVILGEKTPIAVLDEIKNTLQQEYNSKPKIYQIKEQRTSFGFMLEEVLY